MHVAASRSPFPPLRPAFPRPTTACCTPADPCHAATAQLLADLYEIPQRSTDRKINEFVKRVRAVKIHILVRQRQLHGVVQRTLRHA